MIPKLMSIAVLFAALMLVGGDQHLFGIDGKPVLCVPDSDLDPMLLPYADESIDLHAGSGHTPGFGFLFSPKVMRSTIGRYDVVPGFEGHPYVNSLSGTVGFLGQDDRTRFGPAMKARDITDEWYSRDQCPQPTVTPLVGTTRYEVECNSRADYGAIWSRAPDPKITMPDPDQFVVATCKYENIQIGPYTGKSLRSCSRVVIIDSFSIEYRFQEENAGVISEIDSMIRDKLSEWKRNCSI